MYPSITFLQDWYRSQCNGKWEHGFGIEISSLDNPGWYVEVDLEGTALEAKLMESIKIAEDGGGWMNCFLREKKFIGSGDPSKLERILRCFQTFADSHGGFSSLPSAETIESKDSNSAC